MKEDLSLYGNQLNMMTTTWTIGKLKWLYLINLTNLPSGLHPRNSSITVCSNEDPPLSMAPISRAFVGSIGYVYGSSPKR
jgi:hypothetical protein